MATRAEAWIEACAAITVPERIEWCDGSQQENERLVDEMLRNGVLHELDQKRYPGCTLHRSHPNDVARVEHCTYICSQDPADAGPTNHWMDPAEARFRVTPLFQGCMKGRTLYVIPYLMGPAESPHSKVGIELTDSPYVVASMRVMTTMGKVATARLERGEDFVAGLHSTGDLDPERRYILHFPEERLIWSYGSGYGGNALLGKKCFALRIASRMARDEGWMAEHMLLLELENPQGESIYIAGAFPSACGKTNLAMLVSALSDEGYRVRPLGDDIVWMRIGEDGRLWAMNPEAGMFGVVPGTNLRTNPNAMAAIQANTIYTNVAVTDDGAPWWEGLGPIPNSPLTDWRGNRPWSGKAPAAHPNARFTSPMAQVPSVSSKWREPFGVPVSAILFGGRRSQTVPLVFQAFDWDHGVFLGATMASATTAAAAGQAGVLRYDPMAMLPFCGYHMGDYFGHWIEMGRRLARPPAIFHVNWFRQDADGRYLWPGYGENIRVLVWILERLRARASGRETPVGIVPRPNDIHLSGLDISREMLEELLEVHRDDWKAELPGMRAHLDRFGNKLPTEIDAEFRKLKRRLD